MIASDLLFKCAKPRKDPCLSNRCGAACGRSTANGLCGVGRGVTELTGAALTGAGATVPMFVIPPDTGVTATLLLLLLHASASEERRAVIPVK